ncbi:MAG: tRNA (guanosine(46)-N7)-methyltransferase TrmB [Fusicatenibacter sp.]|nr:tRNA (guanosine(46)-N7)-methyltransferase TrmB [Fusicatenibacter sp.]
MRLRNIRGSKEVISASEWVVQEPETKRGNWSTLFGNTNPIHIEVGMGKGRFLMDMAVLHPEINYVGIEMYDSVLLRAVQKREKLENEIPNLYFIRMDARQLPDVFWEEEVERIYLNFSDPWPKDRHAKRRLTSGEFLGRYEKILKRGGTLEFKTDNRELFEFSLKEMKAAARWELTAFTFDLHHEAELCEGNVMTEYEEKFSSAGNPICKMEAKYLG